MEQYIREALVMGFIWPSKSLEGTGFFFTKKKTGELYWLLGLSAETQKGNPCTASSPADVATSAICHAGELTVPCHYNLLCGVPRNP